MFKSLRQPRAFYKSFFALALPMILQNLISSSMGLVDTFMVGTLGQEALGGLSLANTPFFVAMLFVFGLQSGGAVLISQYWGKRDVETINRVIGLSIMFAVGVSAIFATVVFLFPEAVMGLTTNNPELLDVAVRYGKVVAYSYVLNSFTSLYTGARRSCESPKLGTAVVVVGMCSNVVFNYIFIFGKLGFEPMGVEGAAWGTMAARIVEFAIVMVYIFVTQRSPKQVLKLLPSKMIRPGRVILKDFLKYAAPVMANETIWSLGSSMYTIIFGHLHNSGDVTAAYALSKNIEQIVMVAVFAISNATAVLIGKEIGAGADRETVKALGRTFTTMSFLAGFASGVMIIILYFVLVKPFLFGAFSLTDGAIEVATIMLFCQAVVMAFRSYVTTLVVGILRGGGDVNFGLFVDTGAMWLISIPLSALVGLVFEWDFLFVYICVLVEEPVKAMLGIWRFRSGKWIRNVTREQVA